jgi:hypothetical protein
MYDFDPRWPDDPRDDEHDHDLSRGSRGTFDDRDQYRSLDPRDVFMNESISRADPSANVCAHTITITSYAAPRAARWRPSVRSASCPPVIFAMARIVRSIRATVISGIP